MNRSASRNPRRRKKGGSRGPESSRSIAARILNRYESSTKMLDEVMAVEFSQREHLDAGRRHRTRLLVNEVVKRRATLDQMLKVFSTRGPAEMENHVRTVLRMALAEWFFVPPAPGSSTAPPDKRGQAETPAEEAVNGAVGGSGGDGVGVHEDSQPLPEHAEALAEGERPEPHPYEDRSRDAPRRRDRQGGRGRRRGGRRGRDRDSEEGRWDSEDSTFAHEGDPMPVARGPVAAATVNLLGTGRPSRGFVNGVLRAVDRASRFRAGTTLSIEETPRRALPAPEGIEGIWEFARDLFADPEKKPATWLSQYQSLPRWLTERFLARYGLAGAVDVARASNATPALSVRVNTREITPEQLRERMQAEGIEAHETELPEVLRIEPHVPLTASPLFEEGLIYLQDLTAARTTHALELQPGMRILDACAAPGGKITHACEQLDGKGFFYGLDVSRRRLRLLQENLDRLGHNEIQAIHGDLRDFAYEAGTKFDVIFVDAPCTNTGVLARRIDARWRVSEELQKDLIKLQLELLQAARSLLAPNGRIVYSTCTLEPEENRGVVAQTDLKLEHDALWLPEAGRCDGGYTALLRLGE